MHAERAGHRPGHRERDGEGDPPRHRRQLRPVVGRWVNTTYRRRPMIVPLVIEA
ncbi:hypothetical protein GRS83_13510 [Rathayibacter rathayi NCPPB 2980 = VKM Ac-1601]|nr:hypothetical protein [Rathayibacter rathayi NCPPB 2980 = VKM Ac-1601]